MRIVADDVRNDISVCRRAQQFNDARFVTFRVGMLIDDRIDVRIGTSHLVIVARGLFGCRSPVDATNHARVRGAAVIPATSAHRRRDARTRSDRSDGRPVIHHQHMCFAGEISPNDSFTIGGLDRVGTERTIAC